MRRMAMRRGVVRACEEALGRHGPRLGCQQGNWRSVAVKWGCGALMPVRHMETGTSTGTMVQNSETEVLKSLVGGMTNHARGFPIKGDSVEILETPSQFYNVLLQGVRNARSRVVIASLYIGTGTLEQELLDAVADSLARKPSLQVTILCDALRTTRPSRESDVYPSSAAMLSNILLSDRVAWRKSTTSDRPKEPLRIALYHTPMMTQVLKMILPARVQEIVGVCHLKVFIFDDNVIMTGANMSTSYFTVRQDRYLCFPDCKNLASYFCSLINTVALYSYNLDDMGQLQPRSAHLDPVSESELFCTELSDSVKDFTTPSLRADTTVDPHVDTWVFPTVQMGPLGIRQDEEALLWLLKQLPGATDMHLSSPYFNLTPAYEDAILEAARDKLVHILTASPKANGFYGSSGISGFIPLAYSLLEQQLHDRAVAMDNDTKDLEKTTSSAQKARGLSIHEYERLGWTFHAKGLWCSLPGAEHGPSVSLVGSSNLGYRSRDRDLEAQLFVFTLAPRLQQQLERERDDLFVRASRVTSGTFRGPDRQAGLLSQLALKLVKPWL